MQPPKPTQANLSQTENVRKWYDKKAIIIILLVVFFPIGLYGLWKGDSFGKIGKIIISVIFSFIIIGTLSQDESGVNKINNDEKSVISEVKGGWKYLEWGMNIKEVKALLKKNGLKEFRKGVEEENNALVISDKLWDVLKFDNGRLISGFIKYYNDKGGIIFL